MWFWAIIYNYKSSKEANNQFLKLKPYLKADNELVFSKDHNFIIAKDNQIYHLMGGCVYSRASWNKITQSFSKIFYKNNEKIAENTLESPYGY